MPTVYLMNQSDWPTTTEVCRRCWPLSDADLAAATGRSEVYCRALRTDFFEGHSTPHYGVDGDYVCSRCGRRLTDRDQRV